MKKILFMLLLSSCVLCGSAKSMRELWVSLPDSIAPYLNADQRQVMLNFMGMGLKGDASNSFGGKCVVDTLTDDYGKPKSSLHKAYESLLENYNVYFVAPAPTNDHEFLPKVQTWIEQYISAPAWNHIIFTNQPQFLYGDYFISANLPDSSLGTGIAFGSDEFKTWEEVITFFERLGGQ